MPPTALLAVAVAAAATAVLGAAATSATPGPPAGPAAPSPVAPRDGAGRAEAAGGAELVVENAARGRTVRVALAPGEGFAIVAMHSMYDAPVTEEFRIDAAGAIVLEAVSSPSAAVREYLGLSGPGERHRVARRMGEVVFRVAAGAPQRLRAGGRERSFLELGEHGDRLVFRAGPPGASASGREPPRPRDRGGAGR